MTNHPNRKKIFGLKLTERPTAAQVKAIREAEGMTQEEAAAFVHVSTRTWQAWELDQNPMSIATWEHWHLKIRAQRRPAPP